MPINSLIIFAYPMVSTWIGPTPFHAVMCLLTACEFVWLLRYMPETKGKAVADIVWPGMTAGRHAVLEADVAELSSLIPGNQE